jgi:transaldolase/glucose-6-phosphate isomerase
VRWEIATAIAGSILGINPFNQPDVEASKIATKALTSAYEKTGRLPSETPFFEGEGVRLFADPRNTEALKRAVGGAPSLTAYLKVHLDQLGKGDYLGLLAYVPMTPAHEEALQRARHRCNRARRHRLASAPAFHPRVRHKGRTARFRAGDLRRCRRPAVPGQKYSFGTVNRRPRRLEVSRARSPSLACTWVWTCWLAWRC